MSHPVEIFENKEASKLLDYFVAYKKLMSKVEYIKCISKINSEIHFCQYQAPTEITNLAATEAANQPTIGFPASFEK